MIMMRFGRGFIACTAIAEIMPIKNPGFFEQPDSAVDRSDRDARIFGRGARVQRLHVGMIGAARQDARDDPALLGNAQAAFGAEGFDVYRLLHGWVSVPVVVERVAPVRL